MTFRFPELLAQFTDAVAAGDGTALGALFTDDGTYTDTFYGAFTGRDAIRETRAARRRSRWRAHSP